MLHALSANTTSLRTMEDKMCNVSVQTFILFYFDFSPLFLSTSAVYTKSMFYVIVCISFDRK